METGGVFVVITNLTDGILLVKRKDYPLWDLPSGQKESNETIEACAIRECYEETGYTVELTNFIGLFERTTFNDSQYIFVGKITGGAPISNGLETADLKWFAKNKLPLNLIPNRKKQLKMYFNQEYQQHLVIKEPLFFLFVC